MKIFISFAMIGAMSLSTPASAQSLEQALCPLETLGDEKAEALAAKLLDEKSEPSTEAVAILQVAVNGCAEKFAWKETQSVMVLDFNVSVITSVLLEEKLTAAGVDMAKYGNLLDTQEVEALKQLVNDAGNSKVLHNALDRLVADLGDKANDTIVGNLGAYLAVQARAILLSMEMMKTESTEDTQ